MNIGIFFRTITISSLFLSSFAIAQLPNIGLVKLELKQYHDCGAYQKDLAQKISQAQNYLLSRIRANTKASEPKKLAIVLDIDETSLSNYEQMASLDFGGTFEQEHTLYLKGQSPAIKQTLALFNLAKQNKVAVFFVTGRPEAHRDMTIKSLQNAGYQGWSDLYMKDNNYHQSSIIPFKSATRKMLTQNGYDVVLSMGDQVSDLKGGYADKTFLLANPFYYLP